MPLSVIFASIALNRALGAPVPDIAEFNVWYSLPMAIAVNIVNPLNAQLSGGSKLPRLGPAQAAVHPDTARPRPL